MTDVFPKEKRSEIMSKVRSWNTKPEIKVRKWLHKNGYRFRLHRKDLPGHPDIVLPKYKTAIFVHGCFWHRHLDCKRASMPQSNEEMWTKKFGRNVRRDELNQKTLEQTGWKVIVLWECEIANNSFTGKLIL